MNRRWSQGGRASSRSQIHRSVTRLRKVAEARPLSGYHNRSRRDGSCVSQFDFPQWCRDNHCDGVSHARPHQAKRHDAGFGKSAFRHVLERARACRDHRSTRNHRPQAGCKVPRIRRSNFRYNFSYSAKSTDCAALALDDVCSHRSRFNIDSEFYTAVGKLDPDRSCAHRRLQCRRRGRDQGLAEILLEAMEDGACKKQEVRRFPHHR